MAMGVEIKVPPAACTPSQTVQASMANTEKMPADRKKNLNPAVNTVGIRVGLPNAPKR